MRRFPSAAPRAIRTGCDIVALADVEHSIAQFGDRYLNRVFSASELRYCDGPERIPRLAARFAAKEAVIKALAEPSEAFGFSDIEVEVIDSVPRLVLRGTAARLASDQGWVNNSVSLSHAQCHAAAVVAAICTDGVDRPAPSQGRGRLRLLGKGQRTNRSLRDGKDGC